MMNQTQAMTNGQETIMSHTNVVPRLTEHKGGYVEAKQVSISFTTRSGITEALSPTDLKLEPGSFTALIGPSGCGKSTLLNAVAGFTPVSSGELTLDGSPITAPGPDTGMVFQQYALFPWLTAFGNVCFALRRMAIGKVEMKERALEALREVGLEKQAYQYPSQLSGGMKQRVAIARTLVAEPKVLLMDEPFGALDAQTRLSMHHFLLRVLEKHRATVLFVTHDVDEGLTLADDLHVFSSGPGRIIRSYHPKLAPHHPRDDADPERLDMRAEIIELLRPKEQF